MQNEIDSATYLKGLEMSLTRIVFDRSSGESFSFEELFYPLEIDEGKYAFQSYAEQMELAHKLVVSNSVSTNNLGMSILDKVQRLQRRNDSINERASIPENNNTNSSNNDIQSISKQILSKIQSQGIVGVNSTDFSDKTEASLGKDNPLQIESRYDRSSLIISDNPRNSRILAIANAGHGKTTLLRRIALYYCHPIDDENNNANNKAGIIKEKYSLKGQYIPCIILLRDITDNNYSVSKAIERSVMNVFQSLYSERLDDTVSSQIQKWLGTIRDNLLLLIDGLDELSDKMRFSFLSALDDYLFSNPQTHIIMTSRVAGLSETKVQSILQRMGFRGRSIIPLEGDNAREYAERWIDITQPVEYREQFKSDLEQVLKQDRFKDYRELIRTPSELLMILKQIANDTLSSNRYQMFHDNLWEYFTGHIKRYEQKRPIFEDTMTLLSFLAYKMQLNDSLFISLEELKLLSEDLSHLSFHTDLVKAGTLEDYRNVLDELASNVGIIERDDRTAHIVYTFPIRAYQEFLTAYACCHLRLNTELSKPDPVSILSQHLNESRWISITNFALSDLGSNNQREFDAIINLVFENVKDIEQLRAVVEADLAITKNHAIVLCNNVFSFPIMNDEQKELLVSCMNTKSAYAYVYALSTLYQSNSSDNKYIEANALSNIIWLYNSGNSAFKNAVSYIQKGDASHSKLGAEMLTIMARSLMDEISSACKSDIIKDFKISEDVLFKLSENANNKKDIFSIIALTNIWLSKTDGSSKVKSLLNAELASLVIEEINKSIPVVQELCLKGINSSNGPDYKRIQELVFSLGSFPLSTSTKDLLEHKEDNIYISAFLQAMYKLSKEDVDVDQVAVATACLYYCWDLNSFMDAWVTDICKGLPIDSVRKDMYSIRERNHFDLVKNGMKKLDHAYRDEHMSELNVINDPSSDPIFSMFRRGDYRGAANYCIANMGSGNASKTNLAFLLRYGHLEQDDLNSKIEYSIPVLLEEGVSNKECYSLINLALYELERGHITQAKSLWTQISQDGWKSISEKFWYPELWMRNDDPEGALVCVLANQYSNCQFEDLEEMKEVVKQHFEELSDILLPL